MAKASESISVCHIEACPADKDGDIPEILITLKQMTRPIARENSIEFSLR
jgi:hypothetical protein